MAHTIASNKPREFLPRIRRAIENLSPYQSLALLAVPACIVEPLKFAAIAIAGEGHWFTGTAVIVGAYATSLLLIDRLFWIVKPKLLKLSWFAKICSRLIVLRYRLKPPRQTRQ